MRKLATMATMVVLIGLAAALFAGCNDDADKAYLPPFIGTDPATGGQVPAGVPLTEADLAPGVVALPPGTTTPANCVFNGRVTSGCDPAQIKSICNDGTGSCSTGSGTCSGHGGVCATL